MKHSWNRTPEEQANLERWARGEAPPPLAGLSAAVAAEKQAYREARASKRCPCEGSGQVLVTYTVKATGLHTGTTAPCHRCRPEDHVAAMQALRASHSRPPSKG